MCKQLLFLALGLLAAGTETAAAKKQDALVLYVAANRSDRWSGRLAEAVPPLPRCVGEGARG